MPETLDIDKVTCPLPLRDYAQIVLGHGGGGSLSAELIEHLLLPAFRNPTLELLTDAAVLPTPSSPLVFTTDSYVVRPLFFPGGSIGELAVYGTINDLAMSGARPHYLSAGFIIEEGFAMDELIRVVRSMAAAAERVGVPIVTGDTKVVDRGHGDGIYINTAGIGSLIDPDRRFLPTQIQAGDALLVSGTIGDHGMAIMSVREGLRFDSVIESDSAPLHTLVEEMIRTGAAIRTLRDPTRGGIASTLNEWAHAAKVGIELQEAFLPIQSTTQAACDLLGMDPMFVANEGKLLAVVDPRDTMRLVDTMRKHAMGRDAAIIGRVTAEHPGIVVAHTAIGGKRVITMQIGEQLPRIC